jgi:hypothetical protein
MNGTGAGITGVKDTINFQKYIVKYVCKYYFELKPVFGDRQYVKPWFTNEDKWNDENNESTVNNNIGSSDEESVFSIGNNDVHHYSK